MNQHGIKWYYEPAKLTFNHFEFFSTLLYLNDILLLSKDEDKLSVTSHK